MARFLSLEQRVLSLNEAEAKCAQWREEGRKMVFTNGVFDLLHRGHVTYLEAAAAKGDVLVVGVNDDASVRRLGKGDDRPIVGEDDRARVVAALRSVAFVLLFSADTPLELIQRLKPDVLVKGGDYDAACTDPLSPHYIVGSAEVKSTGGSVETIALVPGRSTTAMAIKLKGQ